MLRRGLNLPQANLSRAEPKEPRQRGACPESHRHENCIPDNSAGQLKCAAGDMYNNSGPGHIPDDFRPQAL